MSNETHLVDRAFETIFRHDHGRDQEAATMLDLLRTPAGLRAVVNSVLTDGAALERFSHDSYNHHNGFVKILLRAAPDDRYRLRLHLWPTTDALAQNIHDHRFDFWSVVLLGTISNHIWTRGPGTLRYHYKYHSRAGNTTYVMERCSSVELTRSRRFRVEQGAHYYFDNSWLHTIECDSAAITLMLEDRRNIRPYANVFSVHDHECNVTVSSPSLTKQEYRETLDRFVAKMEEYSVDRSRSTF